MYNVCKLNIEIYVSVKQILKILLLFTSYAHNN